jgi:hypothetical protein
MTFNDNLAAHYANVEQSNVMNSFIKYYIDSELVALKNLILDGSPETLDTLNELAAALGDDPEFFTNMQADLQAEVERATGAESALSDRVDTLEADPVTKTYVDNQDALALPKAGGNINVDADAHFRYNKVLTLDSAMETRIWSDGNIKLAADEDNDIQLNTSASGKTKINGNAEISGNINVGGDFVGVGDFTCGKLVVENTGTFSSSILPDGGTLKALFEAIGDALLARKTSVDVDAADAALSGRLDTLETDPTTAAAVAAVQADVDQNETDSDAAEAALSGRLDVLEADPTTAAAVAAVQADVDQNETDGDAADAALSGRLDVLEADPTTETALSVERGRIDAILAGADADKDTFAEIVTLINSVDTTNDNAFAAYVLSNDAAVAAVQADVDQNETDGDAADAALSARLDTLEADPTTAAAVAAVQADVDQNEADSDAALALKAPLADPTFTGDVSFGSLGRVNPSGNELKLLNDAQSTGIILGPKISLQSNTEVEVFGDLVIENGLTNAADDTAAAAAGVDVNQLYRNGSVVMIRVA